MKTAIIISAVLLLSSGAVHSQYLTVRGSVPMTPRQDVAVAGTNAFAVGANSVAVVSFENSQLPEIVGQVAPGVGTISAIAVRGDYAYCAGQSSGIVVIDISDFESPDWVRNVQAAAPIVDVAVGDTFLAAATTLNITLFGLSDPDQPHLLATYGRAANQLAIDASARRIHCAGTTGAFVVSWTVNQGTVTISAFDEFGSNEYRCVSLGGTYANFGQGLQFSALNRTTYSLAGQYGASGQINTISSGSNYSIFGTASGSIEYLRQNSATPQFASGAQVSGSVNGLAISSNEQFVLAATSSGLTLLVNSPLGVEDRPVVPSNYKLTAYPNPFNAATTISWSSELHHDANLVVYDLLGREVRSVPVLPGATGMALDFSAFSAGTYWVTLQSHVQTTEPLKVLYLP